MLSFCTKVLARSAPMFVLPSASFAIKYTKTHEWIDYDGSNKTAKFGISNFAQEHLGDIVHIELPKVNSNPTQGKNIVLCTFIFRVDLRV